MKEKQNYSNNQTFENSMVNNLVKKGNVKFLFQLILR